MVTILLAVLAAGTNAVSSVLQRKANLREVRAQRTGLSGLADLVRQPLWLAGIGAVIVSFLLQAAALATGELAEVQPLMSLELPLTLLLGSMVFRRRLGRRAWTEVVVMSAGIAIFLFSVHPGAGAPGRTSGLAWATGAGTTAALVVILAGVAYLSRGARRAAVLGVASGISFALTALFISAALTGGLSVAVFSRWQLYVVPAAGLAAMALLQEGLQAGSLVAVQPGVTLSDPVVAVVLGVLLFHERVRTGIWLAPEILGACAVAWGAIAMSRSSAAEQQQDAGRAGGDRSPERRTADSDARGGT
jgi:drug/metabolite transporter (DMT)-like permease